LKEQNKNPPRADFCNKKEIEDLFKIHPLLAFYSKIVKAKLSIPSPLCETVIHALRPAISFVARSEYIKFQLFVKDYFVLFYLRNFY